MLDMIGAEPPPVACARTLVELLSCPSAAATQGRPNAIRAPVHVALGRARVASPQAPNAVKARRR